MAPTHMQLQNLSQKKEESFKEYAQRWREMESRVQPPLLEKELVDMFMGTLQGMLWYGGRTDYGFAFVFANVSVEQESPPTFYFILRKG